MTEKIYPVEHELGLKLPEIISKLFNNCEPVLTAASVNGYGREQLNTGKDLYIPTEIAVNNKRYKILAAILFSRDKTPLIRLVQPQTACDVKTDLPIKTVSRRAIIPKAELNGIHSVYLVGAMPSVAEWNVLSNGKFLSYYLRTLHVYSTGDFKNSTKRVITNQLNMRVMNAKNYKRVILNHNLEKDSYSFSPVVFIHPSMHKLCHIGDNNSVAFTYNFSKEQFSLQQPVLDVNGRPTRKMETRFTFDSTEQAISWFNLNVTNILSSDSHDILKWLMAVEH